MFMRNLIEIYYILHESYIPKTSLIIFLSSLITNRQIKQIQVSRNLCNFFFSESSIKRANPDLFYSFNRNSHEMFSAITTWK